MRTWPLLLSTLAFCTTVFAETPKPTAEQIDFFEKKIRPIFSAHCTKCHGEKKAQAGLRLDTAAGLKKGTDEGPVVKPGDPAKSTLIQAVQRSGDYPMPPDGALSESQVLDLEAWVKAGAAYPEATAASTPTNPKTHWAFQPMREPAVPKTGRANPIDAFIEAKLRERGWAMAPTTDKRTLARRITFDLIGLPPSAEELDAFEKNASPNAIAELVDRLLASPQYGERWGRYWLDVARYADTKGYVFTEDINYPFAYTYRDYVIRSLNEDKPIDRFITEQIAADRLQDADNRNLAALGFLTVGRRFSNNIHDITDDRIDVVSRGLMGLSVACARCHDHKFDPIPTADYYGLYGIFASSHEPKELPVIGNAPVSEKFTAELAKLETACTAEIERIRMDKRRAVTLALGGLGFNADVAKLPYNQGDNESLQRKRNEVQRFKAKSPDSPPQAMLMNDKADAKNHPIFVRGNSGNPGPVVPRKLPDVVAAANAAAFTDGSGRLELARGIANKANPLTARVFVNRVWLWHFGEGLVRTPSDFGVRSEAPTHPELLDWLALRFIDDGWSLKALHRRILLSSAYQQSSAVSAAVKTADPENRTLGRFARKRHDFEALRDSVLNASGQLDRTQFGRSVDLFKTPTSTRRSIYGSIDRQNLPGTFRAFDLASPEQHSPQRFQTTVPQQALFLMNSPFVAQASRTVLQRGEFKSAKTDQERAVQLYRMILSRRPTASETELAIQFREVAAKQTSAPGQLAAWEQLAQVLLLSNEFSFVD